MIELLLCLTVDRQLRENKDKDKYLILHAINLSFFFSVCISLQVLQLEAPAFVKLGQPLHLNCEFDLGGKKLYR